MAEKDKSNLYLLSIVGIVAVVGVIVLVLGGGQKAVVLPTEIGEEAVVGEALKTTPSVQRLILAVDHDAPAEDVILITEIAAYLYGAGYNVPAVSLDSEVKLSSVENNLLVLVRNEEVVIIKPDSPTAKTRRLISDIESTLLTDHGLYATKVAYSNATIDDLD